MTREHISLIQGNKEVIEITLTGVPEDQFEGISQNRVVWFLSKEKGAGTPTLTVDSDTDSNIEIVDASGGVFEITLEESDTEALSPGKYYHEVTVVDADGDYSSTRCDPYEVHVKGSFADLVT